jgi:hypothetical protein
LVPSENSRQRMPQNERKAALETPGVCWWSKNRVLGC